jgi:hypothetical protein
VIRYRKNNAVQFCSKPVHNVIDELLKKKNSVAIDIYTGKVDVYYLSINHRSFFCASAKKRTVDNIRSVFMLIGQLSD